MASSAPLKQRMEQHPSGKTGAPRKAERKPAIARNLLAWYDRHARILPWRGAPGEKPDPYRVWLSEIMLQQTTVAAVAPYYRAFLARWPDVKALASAPRDDILGAWAGLGYYSRARNLHRAAQIVAEEHDGIFPAKLEDLRKLPGVGAYTAAAIGAIAYNLRVAAMDANAERVIARLLAMDQELPKAKAKLALMAEPLVPVERPGDFAQALMDLGSQICTVQNPQCGECPVARHCQALALGIAQELPRKAAKRPRPLKRGAAFVAFDAQGAAYLIRRPEKGLLGAMLEPPSTDWGESFPEHADALENAPFMGEWIKHEGLVHHVFTHFSLELEVWSARFNARPNGPGIWLTHDERKNAALPTVMRKIIEHAEKAEISDRRTD
jgi:A/G-specific adenine glycosylase